MFVASPHLIYILAILAVGLGTSSTVLAAVLLAAYALGLAHTYWLGRSFRRITETVLAVLAVGAALLYAGLQGEHFLLSLQYWLALMLVIRSFRRMDQRDYGFCFVMSAALFAHVGRTYDQLPFLFLTLAALVVTPYALFHYLVQYGGFAKIGTALPRVTLRFTFAQFRFMTGLSLALLAASSLLFLSMPRMAGSSVLGGLTPEEQTRRTTGFADNVELGAFGEVVSRATLVMTVETDRPALWRGGVLDYYQGGVWYPAARYQQRRPSDPPPATNRADIVCRRFEIFDVRQTNFRLFSAGTIVSLEGLNPNWRVRINDLYAALAMTPSGMIRDGHAAYTVESADSEFIGSPTLRDREWPVPTAPSQRIDEADLFLQVPADVSDRIRRLALELTAGLNTIDDKAAAVERHLGTGFAYSTRNLKSGRTPPLEYFLFESRAGHCEYFASAMAMLLRCAGVRTRVVQGFAPGSLVDGRYIVRLSDAHLWTEVFYPGQGWKTFDPTPGGNERIRGVASPSLLDELKLRWETYVLNYDRSRQLAMFDRLGQAASALIQGIRARMPSPWVLAGLAALACALIVLVRLARWLIGRIHPFHWFGPSRPSVGKVRSYFGQYLKEIARKGYKRSPGTTPNDLLAALTHDRAPIVDDAAFLTRLFYDTRFGNAALSRDQEHQIAQVMRRIRNWTR